MGELLDRAAHGEEEVGDEVLVHAVLDGRRDLQDLLAWRLLR